MLPDFCWSPQHFHESWHDGLLSAQWCYLQHILMWAHRVYSHCQQVAHCTDLNWATNRTTDFVKSKVDLEYCLKWMNRCKYSHKFMIMYDWQKRILITCICNWITNFRTCGYKSKQVNKRLISWSMISSMVFTLFVYFYGQHETVTERHMTACNRQIFRSTHFWTCTAATPTGRLSADNLISIP